MHVQFSLFFLVGMLGVSAWVAAEMPPAISLNEAVSEAVQHNFSLATREIETTFPEIRLEISKADFRWKILPSLQAGQGRDQDATATAQLRADKTYSPGTQFEIRAQWMARENGNNGESVDLQLEQPLFQKFGKLSSFRYIDEAHYQLEIARLQFQRETESLILRVVNRFTAVLNQQERLGQETAALVRAADLVRLVKLKQRQGHATGVDVLEMKMLHQEAELRFRKAEEGLVLSRAELAELMGRVSDQLPDLKPVEQDRQEILALVDAENLARKNRVERTQALLGYENARRQLKLEERERYPDVRLIANWQPVNEQETSGWFAGLRAEHNLDLHVVKLQIAQQQNQVQAALLQIAATELQIHREVLQARSRLQTLDQEREIAESQLDLSRERLRLAKGLYPSGRTSSVQLRDAEVEWVDAQSQKTDVILQQVRARYQFWYALGLLLGDPGDTRMLE